MNNIPKQKLSWPEWSRIPGNQKLIQESMVKAKIKYQHDLTLAEDYNKYLMYLMGLISTPASISVPSGGGQIREGIGHYMIGTSDTDSAQFIIT